MQLYEPKQYFILYLIRFGLILALLAGVLSILPAAGVQAGTGSCFNAASVTSTADSGAGSLRQAVSDLCAGGKITFNSSLSGQTITLTSAQLTIAKNMTIDGSGLASQVTVSGGNAVRVIYVNASVTAAVKALKVTKGEAATGNNRGGGIYNAGTLTLSYSTITGNHATLGGGIYNDSPATLNLLNSTISSNSGGDGAGVYAFIGTLTVANSIFSGNHGTGSGGAILQNAGGTLTISNSTFSANTALYGGGIVATGTNSVTNSTFSGNSADDSGGGIDNIGTLTLTNSTFSGNGAPNGGITNEHSGTLTYTNNILAGAPQGVPDCKNDGTIAPASKNNLVQSDDPVKKCVEAGDPTYLVGVAPQLSALADNGGPTRTMALQGSSPAINAGDYAACTAAAGGKDQRSVSRISALSQCDLGAYEGGTYVLPAVGSTTPTDGAVVNTALSGLNVVFNKDVDANTVTNSANYLLVSPGSNLAFDTGTCKAGLVGDDVQIPVNSVSYDPATYTASLVVNGGSSLGSAYYRLWVCGTTSITDTVGIKINNGTSDTLVSFVVDLPPSSAGGLPGTGFAPGRVSLLPIQPLSTAYAEENGMALEIPALGVYQPIVGVPQDGGWNVSWLGSRIGYLVGTAFPSHNGNSVLAAHNTTADGLPGPFVNLGTLKYGDRIILHAFGQQYVFQVHSVQDWVPERDTRLITRHESLPWLTLVTCRGYNAKTNSYDWRTIARAVLVAVEPE